MRSSTRSILSLLRILALAAGLIFLAPNNPGQATDGRDFAGFYEISNVSDLGDTVRLTLTVRVYNYSDADVADATVTLQDSIRLEQDYGSYPGTISMADRQCVRLSSDFTIPHNEYDRWQNGATPSLRTDYIDSAGNPIRRMIELSQGLVGEE